MKKRLAIIITHPIQYFSPVFKTLAQHCELHVFYTWGSAAEGQKFDQDFQKEIAWDIPLLEGYSYTFLNNVAKDPGSHQFLGIQNPDIIDKINTFSPHAILVYGWAYKSHLKVLRHYKGKIPVWFRGDSTLLNDMSLWKKTLRKIFLRQIYKNIDKAFYVGTASKAYFLEYGLKESQLVFAPHAVDNNRFAEDKSYQATSLRKELGILEDAILILFAGKFEPRKNPQLLLDAFIEANNKDVHLLLVGNGPLENQLKTAVNDLMLKNNTIGERIHFLDFQNQSEMPVCYQASDLFCLPSQSETWGLAVNEAMAAGKAIIVSNQVGCAADLIKNTENGYIFKDKAQLTLQLKQITSNKNMLPNMGGASRKIIKEWSFETQVTSFMNELERLPHA
ncbi:glycosyltransferase family 4 protein [Pedobacter rhizosphaerae]|uniref:Glycosyltransferase involved in cell wall bisynthesis n=1 Tax=Pedobacter rhizosphaerae TaxID=390241 RepID=A0A1H9N633_9SPHI|nr:glycosyltransferase family 4 protein [Pedobacter rhizosphaerae]SER31382.1 Glycosyltransferase involved in cell wall bisynthesis [Pedobacter rhizosphaerae]